MPLDSVGQLIHRELNVDHATVLRCLGRRGGVEQERSHQQRIAPARALIDIDSVTIVVNPVPDTVTDTITTNEETVVNFNVLTGAGTVTGIADNFEGFLA